ncbi:MAG: methyltransferase domain-containing protein [Candidatus Rokuibacteriota bacterium]
MTREAPRPLFEIVRPFPLVALLGRFLLEYGALVRRARRWPDDDLLIRAAYRALLDREPDPSGAAYFRQELRAGRLRRRGVLLGILRSREFRLLRELPMRPAEALHRGRVQLIRECLPPADDIVDLGGAAPEHPDGALLLMGYPHRARRIYVVDLLVDGAETHDAKAGRERITADGTRVTRLGQSMASPLPLADASVDLVVAGESIEHVTEAEADALCREAYRVLRPGGSFCLDTPNAALTRLESPHALIHPDHKKEYQVDELRAKLERWRFEVVEARGICPMPESLKRGVLDYHEMVRNALLVGKPEDGYLFYLRAIKRSPRSPS